MTQSRNVHLLPGNSCRYPDGELCPPNAGLFSLKSHFMCHPKHTAPIRIKGQKKMALILQGYSHLKNTFHLHYKTELKRSAASISGFIIASIFSKKNRSMCFIFVKLKCPFWSFPPKYRESALKVNYIISKIPKTMATIIIMKNKVSALLEITVNEEKFF